MMPTPAPVAAGCKPDIAKKLPPPKIKNRAEMLKMTSPKIPRNFDHLAMLVRWSRVRSPMCSSDP